MKLRILAHNWPSQVGYRRWKSGHPTRRSNGGVRNEVMAMSKKTGIYIRAYIIFYYLCTAIVIHQMTPYEAIQHTIAPELQQLNEQISSALSSDNELMQKIVDGYLASKGKQIRPIMVILTAKLFGGVNPDVISAGAAVEMLHNASLIHDDVVDETAMRRGRSTINSLWDNHIAVLVGDFFVSNALSQAINTSDVRIISSIARLGTLLSVGEMDQIYNAREHLLDEESYFRIISHKTASLFVACVEMGAYAVKADEKDIEKMREFAHLVGLCFQIKDDIFDYYSDSRIGKPTGNDLREGKVTLPLLHVLKDSTLDGHDAMLELVGHEILSHEEIEVLINFAKDNGGIEYAYSTMKTLSDKARGILDELASSGRTDENARKALHAIIDYIVDRDK